MGTPKKLNAHGHFTGQARWSPLKRKVPEAYKFRSVVIQTRIVEICSIS